VVGLRVKRLEIQTGINEPCEVCDAVREFGARLDELAEQHGARDDTPPVMMTLRCAWCLTPVRYNVAIYAPADRALFERNETAYRDGLYCLPENLDLYEETEAAFRRAARERFAACYDEYERLTAESNARIDDIARRKAPRLMYLCRVPGCQCEAPKTPEEWRAAVQVDSQGRRRRWI
jgi:hypothetical protein